jgi:hypothetical protein
MVARFTTAATAQQLLDAYRKLVSSRGKTDLELVDGAVI